MEKVEDFITDEQLHVSFQLETSLEKNQLLILEKRENMKNEKKYHNFNLLIISVVQVSDANFEKMLISNNPKKRLFIETVVEEVMLFDLEKEKMAAGTKRKLYQLHFLSTSVRQVSNIKTFSKYFSTG